MDKNRNEFIEENRSPIFHFYEIKSLKIEDTSETIKFQCKFCKQKRTAPFNQTSNLFKHLHYDKKHKDNQDIQNWLKKYESYKKSKKNDISPLSIKKKPDPINRNYPFRRLFDK